MGKKDKAIGEAPASASSRLTPMDIQQKEFRVSRFGGYKMRDVDEFLDQITDTFAALSAEIDRLRTGGAAPVVGAPDLDDVARQADEIIARARADAARITAEARATGGAAATAIPAAPTGQDRTAVNAFIVREREFLQSLAGLVQEHAETVKDMAKSSRRSAPASAAAASTAPAASEPSPGATPKPNAEGERAAEPPADEKPSRPQAASEPGPAPVSMPAGRASEQATRLPEPEDTVRIEEPAPAGATRREAESDGDRSLRDLFWGED
jgi:DivIVA domain-containing protein